MKKIIILTTLILLVGCTSKTIEPEPTETPPEVIVEPVEFTYQIKQGIEFVEGQPVDFSDAIIGNYDQVEFGTADLTVGTHTLRVTMHKNGETKVIGIPYTITEYIESSDYYLSELKVEGATLSPEFTPENDTYTVDIDSTTPTFTVSAKTQDEKAKITEGLGEIPNPGYNFQHWVWVEAEDGQQWGYILNVVVNVVVEPPVQEPSSGVLTWNGYEIQYPNSQPATIRNDFLILVNKNYRVDESYVPANLVNMDSAYTVYGGVSLDATTYDAFLSMRNAAANEGLNLTVSNCYRSFARQKELYTYYLSSDTQASVDTYSARPGHSEHQTGLACDFAAGTNDLGKFTGTAEQLWMVNNAAQYGFINRFPANKTEITGYQYESWHYRYVGVDIAQSITQSGLVLEEYLQP